MPTFMWNINAEFAGHPTFFANDGALCFTCAGHGPPWVAKQLGATKVGILAYGIAQSSKDCAKGLQNVVQEVPDRRSRVLRRLARLRPTRSARRCRQMKEKGVDVRHDVRRPAGVVHARQGDAEAGHEGGAVAAAGLRPRLRREERRAARGFARQPAVPRLRERSRRSPRSQKLYEWAGKAGVQVRELTAVGWQLAAEFYTGLAGRRTELLAGGRRQLPQHADRTGATTDSSSRSTGPRATPIPRTIPSVLGPTRVRELREGRRTASSFRCTASPASRGSASNATTRRSTTRRT